MMYRAKRIGIRLRTATVEVELARRGWTHKEFARRLHTTPAYLSAVLNAYREPGISLRARMQRVLRRSFNRLFYVVVGRTVATRRSPKGASHG